MLIVKHIRRAETPRFDQYDRRYIHWSVLISSYTGVTHKMKLDTEEVIQRFRTSEYFEDM